MYYPEIPDKASFYLLGNPNNLYKYEEWKENMKKYYIEDYGNGVNNNDILEFNKIWTSKDKYDIHFKYQLYTETIHNLLINDCKYKIGDVFYIEHEYESRQYYGIGRISYDIENNKKILLHHEDDGFCISDKIFPKLIQESIDKKPDFYENVLKDYEEYFVESNE